MRASSEEGNPREDSLVFVQLCVVFYKISSRMLMANLKITDNLIRISLRER